MTAALLLAILPAVMWPEEPPGLTGWASAYAPGVMDDVIAYRRANDLWRVPLAVDWYTAHGAIATNDCSQVGSMATLIDPAGREYRVLVADCGGPGDGVGAAWMTANSIVAELDWRLWQTLTAAHGRPLRIELR